MGELQTERRGEREREGGRREEGERKERGREKEKKSAHERRKGLYQTPFCTFVCVIHAFTIAMTSFIVAVLSCTKRKQTILTVIYECTRITLYRQNSVIHVYTYSPEEKADGLSYHSFTSRGVIVGKLGR